MGHLIPLFEFAKIHHHHCIFATLFILTDGPLSAAQTSFLSAIPSAIDYILLPSASPKTTSPYTNRPRLLAGKHLGYNYTANVLASYGDHWRNLRKISTIEVLSVHKHQMLHAIRADEVKFTIRALDRASEGRRAMDMKAVLFEMTMNVMMRMIAGKKYYSGVSVEDAEEARRFRDNYIFSS
ncbi:hypothetical protein CASFOL_034007 [Castilleja foliolosa]|uniref:Uncharacterized protein n=1 Tax=Castilleja foliolosa TaxID=1961234 RepID=A0ABD3BYM4_9LAMI